MHTPPEHCHPCTLHSGMVTKSNSNSCVCLDAVSSSAYVHFVHMGVGCFQVTHVLESSHVTLQWLINTQLKWQLECFLHLFDRIFVSFFFFFLRIYVFVMFVCLFIICYGWTLFLLTDPSFFKSSIQKSEFSFTGHFMIWLQDLSLPCCFSMKYTWLQKDGATAPCINVKPALIKWKPWKWWAFVCKRALN